MRQKRIVVLSDPSDLLKASTLAQACASPAFWVEAVTPAQFAGAAACTLACWSRASMASADFGAALLRVPDATALGVVFDTGIVPPAGHAIDLSRWRGGAGSPLLSTVRSRAHEVARRGRRWPIARKILSAFWALASVLTAIGVLVGIFGDGPNAVANVCGIPGVKTLCREWGAGGVATREQDEEFRQAMAGGCSALARLAHERPESPHSVEARRRVDEASRLGIPTWEADEFEIAAGNPASNALSRTRAEQLLNEEVAAKAKDQCRKMPRRDQWRLEAADFRVGSRTCEQFSDGWRCSAPATLICKRAVRRVRPLEDCSDEGLKRASLLSRIEGTWGEPGCAVSFRFSFDRQALLIESVRQPAGAAPYRAVSTVVSVSGNQMETRGEDFRAAILSYWTNGVVEQLTWDDGRDTPPSKLRRCSGRPK